MCISFFSLFCLVNRSRTLLYSQCCTSFFFFFSLVVFLSLFFTSFYLNFLPTHFNSQPPFFSYLFVFSLFFDLIFSLYIIIIWINNFSFHICDFHSLKMMCVWLVDNVKGRKKEKTVQTISQVKKKCHCRFFLIFFPTYSMLFFHSLKY